MLFRSQEFRDFIRKYGQGRVCLLGDDPAELAELARELYGSANVESIFVDIRQCTSANVELIDFPRQDEPPFQLTARVSQDDAFTRARLMADVFVTEIVRIASDLGVGGGLDVYRPMIAEWAVKELTRPALIAATIEHVSAARGMPDAWVVLMARQRGNAVREIIDWQKCPVHVVRDLEHGRVKQFTRKIMKILRAERRPAPDMQRRGPH